MDDKLCNLLEACESPEAPLCPLRENSLAHGIWYSGEPICQAKRFQALPWVKKQVLISNLGLTIDDGFFTVRMLNSLQITAITKKLKGADPRHFDSDSKWLKQCTDKRAPATKKRRKSEVATQKNWQPQLC